MADKLLRRTPYKIVTVSKGKKAIRVNIGKKSTLAPGDYVYQVQREDGVLEMIPEKVFDKLYADKFNQGVVCKTKLN